MAWDHTNGSAIVVRKDSGIETFKDFGGKQFAMPFWYSIHNIISQLELSNAGIKPVIRPQTAKLAPNECNFLVLAPPDMPPALAAGKIDAYCVAEPFNALGELKAGGKILRLHRRHLEGPSLLRGRHARGRHHGSGARGVGAGRAQRHRPGPDPSRENRKSTAHLLSRDGKGYLPFPEPVIERAMIFYNPVFYKSGDQAPGLGQDRIDMNAWPYPSATELVGPT